jgi:hypothetical protein
LSVPSIPLGGGGFGEVELPSILRAAERAADLPFGIFIAVVHSSNSWSAYRIARAHFLQRKMGGGSCGRTVICVVLCLIAR